MATHSFSPELRDWANLQMQLCLSLVSPHESTHRLYGSAPSKLYYISLQPSSPPFLSGPTLFSEQHLARAVKSNEAASLASASGHAQKVLVYEGGELVSWTNIVSVSN